jgi:hypothetical protein
MTSPQKYTKLDMKKIFNKAYDYYDQKSGGKGNIYISKKEVNGLHIAVLPDRDTFVFSEYNLGSDDDVKKLQDYQNNDNVHKTYLCSLCPILEEDNAVILSDEQNQLYLDKKESPAVELRYILIGNSGNKYTITGTVPQYYYGHLLWTTVDHIPTYGLFLSLEIFSDLLLFLKHCTATEPKTKAFFNGTFGSDIYHCHVHLSYQDTAILEDAYDTLKQYKPDTEVYTYNSGIVKLIVVTSTDIDRLFFNVSGICTEYIKIRDTNPNLVLSANFAYTKDRYWVTLQKVNKQFAAWSYDGCGFYTIPSSFIMISDCMKVPKNEIEYVKFRNTQYNHYSKYYEIWDEKSFNVSVTKGNEYLDIIKNTAIDPNILVNPLILENPLEFLWLKIIQSGIKINQKMATGILDFIGSGCISQKWYCDNHTMGKYKYLIGLAVNNLPINVLNARYSKFRINAIFYFLRDYINNGVKSDYLFFRGIFTQQLLLKTFNNFLKITGINNGVDLPLTESDGINDWIMYNFKRIGEPSAMAAGATLSELLPYEYTNNNKKVDVEFFMKIMLGSQQAYFIREFFASMTVNNIRNLVPNYMLCYGGFMCNSNSTETLCDNIAGQQFSYLLLENIKKAETVDRVLKLPTLSTNDEAQDLVDMIYQIVAGLSVGWTTNNFTHFDLHLDNIMRYDFVSNKDYLKLFKIYQEEKGDAIPKIEKIFFKYYTDPKNPKKVFHVPAKYLYVIIDYGLTYTNDMPANSLTEIKMLEDFGYDSRQANSHFDLYTMLSYFLWRIMVSKPYLVFDKNNNWIQNNILVDLFWSFLRNFSKLFITHTQNIFNAFSKLQKSNPPNRGIAFKQTYLDLVKPKHKQLSGYIWYLRDFHLSSVGTDFQSSYNLLKFMYKKYYSKIDFAKLEQQDEVYIFNWGYTPDNIIRGIEPNAQIKDMIKQKNERKQQKINEVRDFVSNI